MCLVGSKKQWIPEKIDKVSDDQTHAEYRHHELNEKGCLLVCIFANFLSPVLAGVHSLNNLDLENDKKFEDDVFESD